MKAITFCIATLFLFFSKSAISQTVGLGNFVWWDLNDNGSRDSGEPVASGYTVYLYQDNDDNGIADAGFTTKTTTTNYNGEFSFTGLAAGKYFVKLYAGYSHYKTTVYGGDPDNNIMGDNNGHTQDLATTEIFTQTITLATGTEPDGTGATNTNTNNTIGIGMWKANGLGDMVWIDNNGNGIYETGEPGLPNVTVKLKNSTGGLLATTTTDAEGKYYFYDPMGYYGTNDYQVEFVTPDGYSPTTCNVGGDDELDSDPVNGTISSINVPMGNWNHSFDAGFKPNTILPVKLINFTALLNNNKVDVKWITTNELNVSHFIVEKSLDGIHFTNAAIVFSQISANNYANYSYTDHINQSQAEYIYYRLLTIDNNGKSQTSEVRKVQIDKAAVDALLITTYPNPVSNEIHIAIPNGWQNKKIIYEIINQAGIPVKKVEIANSTKKQIFNISQLSAGMYIIKVSCEGVAVLQKIIKI